MPSRRPLLLPLLALLAAVAVAGCGSDSGGSGYGPRDSTGTATSRGEKTATATTPPAPPGASARACEGTVAGTGNLRVTGIGCDVGRGIVANWAAAPRCASPAGGSRFSCSVYKGYRCLGATTEAGIAVSCSRQGSSAAFVAKRG
jgi:hypothetical protein